MKRIVIHNGRVIDPSQGLDRVTNVLIESDRIAALDAAVEPDDVVIDATNRIVCPGLIDVCVELREPGHEEDETIATGAAAAIAGGFTTIGCIPNTDPPIDTQASVDFVQLQAERAAQCRVEVLACVSKQREGKELAELGTLAAAGAVGFTDATSPVFDAELMRRALEYAQMFGRPILNRPEVPDLNRGGVMHEGRLSTILGLTGMPAAAEDVMCSRDIRLAEATGGPIHLLGVSTEGTVDLIRQAKSRGLPVTASVFIPNLAADESSLRTFDSNWKLNPPLRSCHHLEACIQGLRDGSIDIITSGHAPRATEKKMDVLDAAPFGMVGLETVLGLVGKKLIEPGYLDWNDAIAKMSTNPARLLGLKYRGTLTVGSAADVTIIDPACRWIVNPREFRSKSSNSPLGGWELLGKATNVIVAGQIKLG
jgi:dihydroorotase